MLAFIATALIAGYRFADVIAAAFLEGLDRRKFF